MSATPSVPNIKADPSGAGGYKGQTTWNFVGQPELPADVARLARDVAAALNAQGEKQ
jgi:hypothetical protein